MPLETYRAKPRRSSRNSADTGAGEKPQLPTTSPDTPTSTREPDAPVPSMTVAPSILRSSISSVESGGPRHGPPIDVRGPDMAPHTPQHSSRPGQAVALL